MTTRRAKQRQQRSQSQLRLTIIIVGALILALAGAFIALRASTPQINRTPEAGRSSAASLNPGDGADICGQFPKRAGQETAPPPMTIKETGSYAAWIELNYGVIGLDLYANVAPQTVNNFMYLACNKFYDGLTFHRVIPGFMAQGGDPLGDGTGGPGYTIPDEFALSAMKFNREGLLSMAHTSEPNSAGSQFFITFAPATHLDGSFTIFGEVVTGMDVALGVTPRDPDLQPDQPGDTIVSIIVREVGQ